MSNKELIHKFYTSFTKGDSKGMVDCYHPEIVFKDPVFGTLKGERAVKMWEMLLSQKKNSTTIGFENIHASTKEGGANWVAEYVYGPKKRNVRNEVSAHFKFKDGKIIEHTDTFDLWKWTQQALGPAGYLLGWTGFMKRKIQKTTTTNLDSYIKKNS